MQANVNGSNLTGTLTWNANGTLRQLAITDPFNASNTQTCTYAYDPIARLSSVNCGSVWSQTFTYDFAGNLKKSGSLSFQPNYTDASGNTNNRYYSGLTGLSYDNDGNLVNDSFYTYSWDKFGKPTTIGGITAVYDAFGRLVEENNAGTYTQFLYAPFGPKVAAMNGTNLSRAYIPLPGGGTFNNASSVNNYRHPNWLGSITFVSSLTRTMGTDRAYAPYGELYANAGGPTQTFAGMISETHTNLYDAVEREYHSSQGRWISPDPAGLAAADPTNPQTWNRYAYVDGNPLANVDPDGLVTLPGCEEGGGFGCDLGGGWGGCGALGGPEGDLCTLLLPPIGLWAGGQGGLGSGGSGGGGTGGTGGGTGGSGGGTGGSGGTGSGIANFPNGENLGIPPGVSANWGGIWGALLPIDPSCEFGPCVSMGEGFGPGLVLAGAGEGICILAEPCGVTGAVVGGIFVGTVAVIDAYRYFSKGGTQEVGHEYVREIARAMPGDYCTNLRTIMQNARKSGKSKLFNDAKATWKQDCRGR